MLRSVVSDQNSKTWEYRHKTWRPCPSLVCGEGTLECCQSLLIVCDTIPTISGTYTPVQGTYSWGRLVYTQQGGTHYIKVSSLLNLVIHLKLNFNWHKASSDQLFESVKAVRRVTQFKRHSKDIQKRQELLKEKTFLSQDHYKSEETPKYVNFYNIVSDFYI